MFYIVDILDVDTSAIDLESALNDVPSIYPERAIVSATDVTNGDMKTVTYTITFNSEAGMYLYVLVCTDMLKPFSCVRFMYHYEIHVLQVTGPEYHYFTLTLLCIFTKAKPIFQFMILAGGNNSLMNFLFHVATPNWVEWIQFDQVMFL